ncbi:type II secretion system F family protein [Variovorax terrae]|uniref:Type II secretion system F family protein n=1 Tax=Variovorax terrae TaxID=2923278 RepID=A0A9X2ANM3_9BURK|nr:type II secretion system F family protein [Variovorax terrae]MCJ0763910.1 type II secretion system F family protein [Variovorax terrae]
MSSATLALGSVALLLVAAGLSGWLWTVRRQEGRIVERHLDRRLAAEVRPREPAWADGDVAGAGPAADSEAMPAAPARIAWAVPAWFLGAASLQTLVAWVSLELIAVLLTVLSVGWVAGLAMLVLLLVFSVFSLWFRIQKRREKLISQLPGFLDSMVRLINIGHSTHAAFQIAVPGTKIPLRGYLDNVSLLVKAGVDLEPALLQVARNVRVEELHLLAAVLGLSVRYGGRADVLLERMANFMRDSEQAAHELVALSSETRLSAWILGLLPVAVGGAIIMINAAYFTRMWNDESGRTLLFGALGLQVFGAFCLYRLARSI